jgi:hypothetical protein
MSMNYAASTERAIRARFQTLMVIWAAQLMALFGFVLLSIIFLQSNERKNPTLFLILAGAGLVLVALSFVAKRKVFGQAVEKQSLAMVQQGQIVAMALCEGAGLLGLLARVITGSPYFYLLFVVAGIGMLLHIPRRESLMAAAFRNRF